MYESRLPYMPAMQDVKCVTPGRCGKIPEPVNTMKVPRTKAELARFRCDKCELIPCCICGLQPRYAFVTLGRKASGGSISRLRCRDCSHPQCTSPSCSTCRTCRNVTCRRKDSCQQPVVPLLTKDQPQTLVEKQSFRCSACKYPACAVCRKAMPSGSRSRFARSGKTEWTCGDCLTLEESRKVRAKHVA